MAILHQAELRPTKTELLTSWLVGRPWFVGEAGVEPVRVAAFRFDDPAGEVGIETLVVTCGSGPVLQVPVTYRGAPLAGAEDRLIGTLEHQVLGTRWVYDATGDPVWADVLVRAIRTGAEGAAEFLMTPEGPVARASSAVVHGTGAAEGSNPITGIDAVVDDASSTTVVVTGARVRVLRTPVETGDAAAGSGRLVGRWDGRDHLLAELD